MTVDANPALEVRQLVLEYYAPVYRYAYRLTGAAADAEDLAQQSFLLAIQRVGQLRDPACVRSWLFAIVRNGYLCNRRRRTPIAECDAAARLDAYPSPPADDWPEDFDPERLQQALDQLTDEFKLVVLGYYFEERSYREIAADLAIPIGTVMSRLSRAKVQLRRALEMASSTERY